MTNTKALILEINDHVKKAANLFQDLFKMLTLDEAVSQNTAMAFGELIKCIKHISLIQGDITGKELLGDNFISSEIKEEQRLNN